MNIKNIELFHIRMPLKFTFISSKKELSCRDTLIIKVRGENKIGFGEVVAFLDPFYTNENLEGAKNVLQKTFIPQVLNSSLIHPFDIHTLLSSKKEYSQFPMAIAGLENALLDFYAKIKGHNIIANIFREKLAKNIPLGIVLGDMPYEKIRDKIDENIKKGCTRFKIKIKPVDGFAKMEKICTTYPNISFLVDANKSYPLNKMKEVLKFDKLRLLCIEEPFAVQSLNEYKNILLPAKIPICFDESINNMQELKIAHELGVLQMLNIKIGRFGGLYPTKEIIDFCKEKKVDFWIGSMLESGISKILHVQLAGLKAVCMTGDLSDSKRYFEQDIINPDISSSHNGQIPVPDGIGLGVGVDENILDKYTVEKWFYSK